MSTRSHNPNRSPFWQRGWGIIFLFFLLIGNWKAAGQNYVLRYGNTAAGAVTFTGNTLGLNKANNVNGPGNVGSIGAFITLNTNLTGGTFGHGTTLNWSNDFSSAVLRMPTNSTVLYAELIWSGSAVLGANPPLNSSSNILNYINLTNTVKFVLPGGSTNSVAPDPATANLVTNGTTAVFYIRSANVTALVQAGGTGTYSVGGVPATVAPLDNNDNCGGWTLAVVYQNSSLHERNMSVFVGNSLAATGVTTPPVGVSGFCSPPTGAVNGYLYVSAFEGDAQITGDQMLFGTTTNNLAVLSGPNNLSANFFASQINYCQPDYTIWAPTLTNGTIDTSGTFGLSNSTPLATGGTEPVSGARQGWDITCVNVSSALTNGVTSAFAENTSAGDSYVVNALALQIDVGSPVLTTSQTVDKTSTYVGDTLTYTVTVTNSGTADAVNLVFTDPLPFGTSFVTNSFTTNGVIVAGVNPVNGVPIPIIKQGSNLKITYQVLVNQIPPSAQFTTAATITFQFAGACAQSPIINGTLVNADVQTLAPLLNVNKVSSLTNIIPGANLTYTIVVPNVGTTNTIGTTLIDQIPAGVAYVTNTTKLNGTNVPDIGGTNMPYTVATAINGPGSPAGVINVGATAVVTFQVKISTNPPTQINNTATIYANGTAPTSAQNAGANVAPVYSDLAVGMAGSPNPVAAGAPITYTVNVTNNGPNAVSIVTNFITLSLPLSASILSPVYTPSIGAYNPLSGVWSGVNLPSNGVATLTISGQVSPNTPVGNISSSVTVTPPTGVIDTITNNNSATASNSVVQSADLAMTISDNATNVYQSQTLTYTLTAINLGPSTLTSITLSNSFSAFLTNLILAPSVGYYNAANGVWNGLNLAAGDSATLTLQATVLSNVTGLFTNTVTGYVPSGVTDPVLTNNTASDVDLALAIPDVGIVKTGPANVYAGTNYTYTITVTNSGLGTASNVVSSDILPTNVTFISASSGGTNNAGVVSWVLTSLSPGVGTTLTLTVTAPTGGNVTNVATVTSSTPDSNPANNTSAPVGTTITPIADMAVGKTGPATVVANSNLTYTISVTNLGPSPAAGIVVADVLPTTGTFVSCAPAYSTFSAGALGWSLGTFSPGQVSNLTVIVKAPASGFLTNIAGVSTTTLDTNSVNNASPSIISAVTILASTADLGVTKTGPTNVYGGANFSYTITVTNSGPASASNVVASDVLPTNVVFVSASGGGTTNAGVANWVLGTLASGNATNVTITVKAPVGGVVTNVATVTSTIADPNSANNTSSPVVTSVTLAADVAIAKTAAATVLASSNLTYTISVTNFGPSSASGVVVTDALPASVTFVSATGGGFNNSGVVNWSLGTLTSGQTSNVTVTVTAPASGSLTNIATVNTPTGDPNLTNNVTPPVITTVTPAALADVAVFKTGSMNVYAGGSVFYTITATNMGPSTASNVIVRDNLPAGVAFQSASGSYSLSNNVVTWPGMTLAAGTSVNFTLTMTAPASGSFVNVASGTSDTPDPNVNNNNGSAASSRVSTSVTPVADLIVLLSGSTNAMVGDNIFYTLVVTNGGPSTASNIVVNDNLPAALNFSSASAGGSFSSNVVNWPTIPVLTNGGSANFTVTVTATNMGVFTNVARAFASTLDLNPTNNDGSSPASQVHTTVSLAQFALGVSGAPVFNPQTGLFEESVTVTNMGSTTVIGVRLLVGGLPSGVTLYDATGITNGTPYVQYNSPLDPGNIVSFALEFYDPSRLPFTNTLTAIAILPGNSGALGTNGVVIDQIFLDSRIVGDPRIVIGFPTTPGKMYTVIYSDNNLFSWQVATPSITANATTTQWYDDGPPKTDNKPFSITSRFYRVIAAP